MQEGHTNEAPRAMCPRCKRRITAFFDYSASFDHERYCVGGQCASVEIETQYGKMQNPTFLAVPA